MTEAFIDSLTKAARAEIEQEIGDVETEIVKLLRKVSRPKWSDHPAHEFHEKIVEHYAPKIAQALKDSVAGIHEAITIAYSKKANKSLAKAGDDDAQDAVNAHVKFSPGDVTGALRAMLADSYLAGSHVGAMQVGGGAKVLQGLEDVATKMDWDNWTPGWGAAAGTVRDGGLQALLAQGDAVIRGIQDTAMTRLGNVLADGIASGDSVQTIASNMSDIIASPERALVISNTEVNAAMTQATLSTYDTNGVAEYEWLAEDDACDECADLDGQTFDVQDSPEQPPEHPNCRCTVLPVVAGQDVAQPTLESSAEDEGDSNAQS